MKFLSLFTMIFFTFQPSYADEQKATEMATEAATEAAIVAAVNEDLPIALASLEKAVNINSGTMNFAGVKAVGAHFKAELEALGFVVELTDGSAYGRAGHLVASYGTKGPKILMIGHLDTVFAKDDDFQSFTPIDATHIAGPGITDMKGGDVIMIAALRALKKQGLLDNLSIKIVMTGDEERSGRPLALSKKDLIDAAQWADVALGFEDGDGSITTAVTSRRGSVNWTLDVTGRPAHSSQVFKEGYGYGAIYEASRILNSFREELSTVDNLTFNPGMIVGGTRINFDENKAAGDAYGKSNVIAKTLKVTGDIRALSPEQLAHAKATMQKIVSDNLAETSAKLVFEEGYPPMAPTACNAKLLAIYSDISKGLGYGEVLAVNPRNAGAADISFAADYVGMAMDGLGLMGKGGHTKDEVADMTSLAKNTQKVAILMYRLSQE